MAVHITTNEEEIEQIPSSPKAENSNNFLRNLK
jgi:hypothetical protein